MLYNKHKLKEIAWTNLRLARKNLQQYGALQCCGLVYNRTGLTHVMAIAFKSIQEKREIQKAFRDFLCKNRARAAAVVIEAWIKQAYEEEELDLAKSVEEMPGHQEAIVIEVRSALACFGILQAFTKHGTVYKFEEPMVVDHPFSWTSEWLDGVWGERET